MAPPPTGPAPEEASLPPEAAEAPKAAEDAGNSPPSPRETPDSISETDFGVPFSEDMLAARGLVKRYARRVVVNQASLAVRPGEVVGLLGPNGAGKTTIFYMIAGVIRPEAGDVYLKGDRITPLPIHKRARRGLGYLPQERSVFRRLTVEQNLLAVLEQIPISRAERIERMEQGLEELNLTQIRGSLGFQLSGGEARRLEIARALALRPSFILLDEPFAGVDTIAVLDIQEVITQIS